MKKNLFVLRIMTLALLGSGAFLGWVPLSHGQSYGNFEQRTLESAFLDQFKRGFKNGDPEFSQTPPVSTTNLSDWETRFHSSPNASDTPARRRASVAFRTTWDSSSRIWWRQQREDIQSETYFSSFRNEKLQNLNSVDQKISVYRKVSAPHSIYQYGVSYHPEYGLHTLAHGYYNPGYWTQFRGGNNLDYLEVWLMYQISILPAPLLPLEQIPAHLSTEPIFQKKIPYTDHLSKFIITSAGDTATQFQIGSIFKVPQDGIRAFRKAINSANQLACNLSYGATLIVEDVHLNSGDPMLTMKYYAPFKSLTGDDCQDEDLVALRTSDVLEFNKNFIAVAAHKNQEARTKTLADFQGQPAVEFSPSSQIVICSGKKDSLFYKVAEKVRDELIAQSVSAEVIPTLGSNDNLSLLADGICNLAITHQDALLDFEKKTIITTLSNGSNDPSQGLYQEVAHLVCPKSFSGWTLSELSSEGWTIYAGEKDSETASSFDYLLSLLPEDQIKGLTIAHASHEEALNKLNDPGTKSCLLDIARLGNAEIKSLNEKFGNQNKLMQMSDGPFFAATNPTKKKIYFNIEIPRDTYLPLTEDYWGGAGTRADSWIPDQFLGIKLFGVGVDTLSVSTQVVMDAEWAKGFSVAARSVQQAISSIQQHSLLPE